MTPFAEGQAAFEAGKTLADNPYSPTDAADDFLSYAEWEEGWCEAASLAGKDGDFDDE